MLGFMYHENKINNLCLHNSMLDKYSIPRHGTPPDLFARSPKEQTLLGIELFPD